MDPPHKFADELDLRVAGDIGHIRGQLGADHELAALIHIPYQHALDLKAQPVTMLDQVSIIPQNLINT